MIVTKIIFTNFLSIDVFDTLHEGEVIQAKFSSLLWHIALWGFEFVHRHTSNEVQPFT